MGQLVGRGERGSARRGGAGVGGRRRRRLPSGEPGLRPAPGCAADRPAVGERVGLSRGPNTPVWVSDNGADVTTLYNGAAGTPESPVAKVLTVGIPCGAPTGQVFNDTTAFLMPGTSTPARIIFFGEDGDLSDWAGGPTATLVGHTDGAVYKGLALAHSPSGPMLLAANFHDNRIDVFDGTFAPVPGTGMFRDPTLPAGYAPFNVAEINGQIFVSYAKQDAD